MSDFPSIPGNDVPFDAVEPTVLYDAEDILEPAVEEEKPEEAPKPKPTPEPKAKAVKPPNPLRVFAASQAAPKHWINEAEVKVLQQQLRDKGFKLGRIDGKYGQKTRDAVKSFQEQADGLNEDGVANRATIRQLFK